MCVCVLIAKIILAWQKCGVAKARVYFLWAPILSSLPYIKINPSLIYKQKIWYKDIISLRAILSTEISLNRYSLILIFCIKWDIYYMCLYMFVCVVSVSTYVSIISNLLYFFHFQCSYLLLFIYIGYWSL